MHDVLRLRCFERVLELQSHFGKEMDIYLDSRGPGDALLADFTCMGRIANLCAVRQRMVNDFLRADLGFLN
jgi:hypothetical protein